MGKKGGYSYKKMKGGVGDGSEFKILDQIASVIGCLAFLACVIIGFWAVLSLIFGLRSPQDTFGIRKVKNCTMYVEPGTETVNCNQIWKAFGRDNNNGNNNCNNNNDCEGNSICDNGVCNNGNNNCNNNNECDGNSICDNGVCTE